MTASKKKHSPPGHKPAKRVADAPDATFPIVGLGASAGGLEAFESFFHHAPADGGMAYVLVPHLDPSHASLLTEILQRTTAMPVVEVLDQTQVLADHVYVIPPNRDMAILHGVLQLSLPDEPRGQRMPIDAFLRSLAEDRGEHAIGIILSGTGTDGTQGLRAILGAGGNTLAQAPDTAKYDGMPNSAIRAGYATYVLAADKMPEALPAIRAHRPILGDEAGKSGTPLSTAPAITSGLNRILLLLRSVTGNDFSLYKKTTIGRRIERRMAQHDINDIEVYADHLRMHPPEVHALFRELLINVTSFFRDPKAFDALQQDILPTLLAGRPDGHVIRVWVAGCASGEEAYSIAILLREYMDQSHREFRVQLYATDLDEESIATARAGRYPPNIAHDITPERLHRFFAHDETGYRVKKDIREMVVFATQNVIKDPPFTRLDLLSCRNLMIYLEPELQQRLLPIFHYALKPDGVLFLSPSESIGSHSDLFTPLSRQWKLYRAVHSLTSSRAIMASGMSWTVDEQPREDRQVMYKPPADELAELTQRTLLQAYAPASVVTDQQGNIQFVHGDTGSYLRPAPGQASLNIVDMAREELQLELRTALLTAASRGGATLERQVSLQTGDKTRGISLSVRPLPVTEAGQELLLVSFRDLPGPAPARPARSKPGNKAGEASRAGELERELAYTRENLQATIEKQQASNEELKSTNEELQSTNEELQSTNEELETSKEELQSVNEELITVNAELQAKIEQLASMQNDMKNLLDNTRIGTLFLDAQLHIRRFTRDAAAVYRLAASDTGRPLGDIKSDLEGDDLLSDAQVVLDTLIPCERELRTSHGTWFLVRIQPYRTLDNVIDGVVLTFTDITTRVEADRKMLAAKELAEDIVNTAHEPLVVLDAALHVITASHAFYERFRVAPSDTAGASLFELGNGQWNIPALRTKLQDMLPDGSGFTNYQVEHDFPGIGRRRMALNARTVTGGSGDSPLLLLAIEER